MTDKTNDVNSGNNGNAKMELLQEQIRKLETDDNYTQVQAVKALTGIEYAKNTARKYMDFARRFNSMTLADEDCLGFTDKQIVVSEKKLIKGSDKESGQEQYETKATMMVKASTLKDKSPNAILDLFGYDSMGFILVHCKDSRWSNTAKNAENDTWYSLSITVKLETKVCLSTWFKKPLMILTQLQ